MSTRSASIPFVYEAMRALFIYPTLTVGGAERQLALLVRALRNRRIAPTILTLKHEGHFFHELRADGLTVHFASMRSRWDALGAWRAFKLAKDARPHIVVTQSIDAQVIGHAIARRLAVPHLTVEHAGPGLPRALHRRMLLRLVAPRVDCVIAVTKSQIPTLLAFGFPADRITVIPNGTEEPKPTRGRAEVRAELKIGSEEVLALMAATLRPEKRGELFVEAVAHARLEGAPVRGVIAGEGPELELVRSRAAALGGCTNAIGGRADVADLILAADIVCLASVAEGLPMIVLEAMALGRPVIATAVGGIPEVVTPQTGVLVERGTASDLGDAIAQLALRPDVRAAMGRAARARYEERFTADRMADHYVAVLRDLVQRHAGARSGGSRSEQTLPAELG